MDHIRSYRLFIGTLGLYIAFCSVSYGQCDLSQSDREVLGEIKKSLRNSIPEIELYPSLVDTYFVYDLTDPSKHSLYSFSSDDSRDCVKFIDGHVYHFSVVRLPFSRSSIGILEKGKLRVFSSINCLGNGENSLDDVVRYLSKADKVTNRRETLDRVRDYRRYGTYRSVDESKVVCPNKDPAAPLH